MYTCVLFHDAFEIQKRNTIWESVARIIQRFPQNYIKFSARLPLLLKRGNFMILVNRDVSTYHFRHNTNHIIRWLFDNFTIMKLNDTVSAMDNCMYWCTTNDYVLKWSSIYSKQGKQMHISCKPFQMSNWSLILKIYFYILSKPHSAVVTQNSWPRNAKSTQMYGNCIMLSLMLIDTS